MYKTETIIKGSIPENFSRIDKFQKRFLFSKPEKVSFEENRFKV